LRSYWSVGGLGKLQYATLGCIVGSKSLRAMVPLTSY
jgi:hypothetical protein